jgi:hypothetical protein
MTRPVASARPITAIAALLMAVTLETPSGAAPDVTGDQAAWQELTAAFKNLEAMSYRMRMTARGQTIITEHVPPDSRRMITRITGEVGEIESITVGNETRSRVIGPGVSGTWSCSAAGPQPPIILTMKDFGVAVEVSRRPDSLIAGGPAHIYELTFTVQHGQPASKTIFYINIQTGLPRRSVTPYPLGGGEIINDYYDYGAPITITLPACGQTGWSQRPRSDQRVPGRETKINV